MSYPPPIPPRPSGWSPAPPSLPPRGQTQASTGQYTQVSPGGGQYSDYQAPPSYPQQPARAGYQQPAPHQYHQPPSAQQQYSAQPTPSYHNQQAPSGQYQQHYNPPDHQNVPHHGPPMDYQHNTPPQPRQVWQPRVGATWQYVLGHRVNITDDPQIEQTEVWIIDLFDTTSEDVAELHRRGRKVIAYFSAGSYEDWRPDASRFPASDMGKKLDDWAGEKWVRTASAGVRAVMSARLDLAVQKGFDGVDPDNADAYDNKNGLGLTRGDAVDYVLWIAAEAHRRGLAVGLKNANDIIPRVIAQMQWSVQEQCVQYGDEEEYLPFVRQGKPVFHVEYPKGEDTDSKKCNNDKEVGGKQLQKCVRARQMGFSTIIKNIKLDQWIQRC